MSNNEKYAFIKSIGLLIAATAATWVYTDMVFDYATRRIDSYFNN